MPAPLKLGQRRSQNERDFEAQLKRRGIEYEYEPFTMVYLREGTGTLGKINQRTYTPDYVFTHNGVTFYIEVKGFARNDDMLKSELVDRVLSKRGIKYMMVGQFGTLETGTKDWYAYKYKNQVRRAINRVKNKDTTAKDVKLKTFWNWLDELAPAK